MIDADLKSTSLQFGLEKLRRVVRATLSQGARDRIWLIRQYLQRFGFLRGLMALSKISKAVSGTITVLIPQSKTPLLLRANTSDVEIFEQIFVHELYGVPTSSSPKLIVDGGANVGYASVYFANQYPEAQIVAFEPEASNFDMLRINTASYPHIKIFQAGIWSKKTALRIENPEDDKCSFRIEEDSSGEGSITAVTIDDILSSSSAVFIDILKLDIEGAEKEVFENSSSWLNKVGVLMVELHDWFKPGCSKAFYSAVSTLNFTESHKGQNVIMVRDADKASCG
jgi:FkbM family methyltransferase